MTKQYWHNDDSVFHGLGADLEVSAKLAWELIQGSPWASRWDPADENATGRQNFKVLSTEEVVGRAFSISDAFLAEAEKRGAIREVATPEQRAFATGHIEQIKHEASFKPEVESWQAAVESIRVRKETARAHKAKATETA